MRNFKGHFKSIIDMKVRLLEVPHLLILLLVTWTTAKHWIYTEEDLKMMYVNCSTPDIILWCEGRSEASETPKVSVKKLFQSVKRRRKKLNN